MESKTSVSYEANVERRAGELVLVIERQTTITPVSNRGNEWQKQQYSSSFQVLSLPEAEKLLSAISSAIFYGYDPEGIADKPEPTAILANVDGIEISRYWSYGE